MELIYYLRVLRRRWMLLAASVLLALTAAALVTIGTEPRYATSITLVVSAPDTGANTGLAYQGVLLSQERAKSYAKLISSRSVTEAVAQTLRDGLTAEDLQRRITAEAVPETVLLRATVTDRSPALAMQIGRTLGTEFTRYVDRLERPTGPAHSGAKITVADDADLPTAPVSPRPPLNLGLGLVIGLIVGVVAAILREMTDTSVTSGSVLRTATGGTTLGVIGLDRRIAERDLPEAFGLLGANLQFARDLPRSLAVTSAYAGEGTSTIARNVAVALAELGRRVILVDANLHRPALADHLGLGDVAGLADVLAGDRKLDDVLRRWGRLTILPAGPASDHPDRLLTAGRLPSVIGELEERADIVLLDTPPVLRSADAAILARGCTGALLVTRYGRTRREQVAEAVERLETLQAGLVGAVLNFAPPPGRRAAGLPALRLTGSADRRSLITEGH